MNRGLAIGAFALVAVIMGMSVIAPAMARISGEVACPEKFRAVKLRADSPSDWQEKDRNENGWVCLKHVGPDRDAIVVDDLKISQIGTPTPPRR